MSPSQEKVDYGEEIISWQVPEYDQHQRNLGWFILAGLFGIIFIIYSLVSANYLFAFIIIIFSLILILTHGQEPIEVIFSLTDEGVKVGKKFFDYDEIKDFSIVYKPKQGIKNLYFEFKNVIRPRLSIPLLDHNPLSIRKDLLKYLPEDLERTDQPLSEFLAKLFKL